MLKDYQGWGYEGVKDKNGIIFNMRPSLGVKCNRFFKYYALTNNSVDALTTCYVYASHPNQLNDSFDCNSRILNFEKVSINDIHSIYDGLYDQFLEFYGNEECLRRHTSEHFKVLMYRHVGILSLANKNTNAHLWHVYSQDSQGFCVELDVKQFPFKYYGPNPIQYVDKLSQYYVNNDTPTALLVQTNVKTRTWEKEEEWRMLVSNPEGVDFNSWGEDGSLHKQFNFGDEHDRKMKYPLSALKSVTLGERFFRSSNIRCYSVSKTEYECVFLNSKEEQRCSVLDFLIDKPIRLYIIINDMGELILQPIEIVKLQSQVYRIIFK